MVSDRDLRIGKQMGRFYPSTASTLQQVLQLAVSPISHSESLCRGLSHILRDLLPCYRTAHQRAYHYALRQAREPSHSYRDRRIRVVNLFACFMSISCPDMLIPGHSLVFPPSPLTSNSSPIHPSPEHIMDTLILHEDPISGNCYKVKLTASILSIPIESRVYHVVKGDTRTPRFLTEVSSYGKIPVLQVGSSTFLPESNAACFYLAEIATPPSELIPDDPLQRAEMLRWMFFEQNQHEVTIAALRFWLKYVREENLDDVRKAQLEGKRGASRAVLDCMDEHLGKSKTGFFVADVHTLTLADIALYAYTHVVADAGFTLDDWPNVARWCEKVTTVEGYIPMNTEG